MKQIILDIIGIAGFASFVYGLYLVDIRIALVVGGLAIMLAAYIISRPVK